jgi:polynucleotide 5'-hydroxyl-kinase GRC3/NOL9
MVEPTDIFKIQNNAHEPEWSSALLPYTHVQPARIHLLQPIVPSVLASKYAPTDFRNLSILSYLHAVFPPTKTSNGSVRQITATA